MKTNKLVTIILSFSLFALFMNCSGNKNNEEEKSGRLPAGELKGTISISGAFALYPITALWAEEFQKLHPNVRIDISAGGAGKGMADALSGIVDLGMFSRGITDIEKAKGVWWIAVTQDAVLPTMNKNSPVLDNVKKYGLTRQDFIDIFINQKIKSWDKWAGNINQTPSFPMNIYTRSDACGAAQMWGEYLGNNQESLAGTGIYGDPGMADAVKKDIHGIGYNNVIYIYDIHSRKKHSGIEVIPIDLNNDGEISKEENFYDKLDDIMLAIKEAKYPSPPARNLFFVSHGKPQNKIVIEFLHWIVTEGQKYVAEAGYVQISDKKLQESIKKLNE